MSVQSNMGAGWRPSVAGCLHEGTFIKRAPWLSLTLALFASVTGCAGRSFQPPPVDSLLDQTRHHQNLEEALQSMTEGLFPPTRGSRSDATRREITVTAASLAGSRSVGDRRFRDDCSGFVQAVYYRVGIDLYADAGSQALNGVAIIHRHLSERGALHWRNPLPGDLIFFNGTHGPRGSRLTHIGIVERVERDGTVVFLHHMQGRVTRGHMNRSRPQTHREPETDRILNDYLRRGSAGPRLSAELFAGYGSVLR